ncbi:S-type anion channel SLAH2 [Glycine soja]|uniref:S-type anion channel SLAH2 n=1 Tax=Glycine soja TaxID=3848 RepID=A0A445L034_GLYSO|nr:S-type anion channel SLAH2 [Glycine soja]
MQSYPPRALDRRLQEDWAKNAREGPRILMSLRISKLIWSTKFRALLSLSLHSSPSSSKLLSMAFYGEDPRPTSSNEACIKEEGRNLNGIAVFEIRTRARVSILSHFESVTTVGNQIEFHLNALSGLDLGPKNALKGGQSNQSQMSLKESPIFFFALGLAYYMVLFVTLSHMLPTNKAIPKDLHPVFFLFVAPSSVAAMAWAKIQGCSSQSFQRIQILTFMVGLHISDEHVVWEDIHEQRALNVFLVVGDCVLVGFQVIDADLQIVYGLKLGIKMNWVLLIEDIMLKSHRLVGYEFPHVVLVLRFIYYFNVDVSNEIVDFTKTFSEITERHIKKLGMRFVDHEWIMVGEPVAGNIDGMEEDAEAEAPQEPAHQWSPFESLMIKKMDDMLHLYQEH